MSRKILKEIAIFQPYKMPTYVNTIIYKICCKNENILDCYIGHTTNLKSRKAEHKYNCNTETAKSYSIKLYKFIRDNGGWNDWDIIKIEDYPCDNKKQAVSRENYWCFELKSTLNSIMPILNIENQDNYNKKISEINKLKTIEKRQQQREERIKYLEDNKEQILQHQKEKRKEYTNKKREKINEYTREYNQKTKERRAELSKIYYENRKAKGYYVKKDN